MGDGFEISNTFLFFSPPRPPISPLVELIFVKTSQYILVGDYFNAPPQHYHISMNYSSMDAHCFSWGLSGVVVISVLDFNSEGWWVEVWSLQWYYFFFTRNFAPYAYGFFLSRLHFKNVSIVRSRAGLS